MMPRDVHADVPQIRTPRRTQDESLDQTLCQRTPVEGAQHPWPLQVARCAERLGQPMGQRHVSKASALGHCHMALPHRSLDAELVGREQAQRSPARVRKPVPAGAGIAGEGFLTRHRGWLCRGHRLGPSEEAPHFAHETDPVDVRTDCGEDDDSRQHVHECKSEDAVGHRRAGRHE
jgi:hypothetical protein